MTRKMKDSGVEWIGDIPEEWKINKTKHYFSYKKIIVGNEVDKYDRLALTLNGVIKRGKDDSEGLQPEKFEGYQILNKNELVFKLIDLENIKTSRVGISKFDGIVSPAYIILTNRASNNKFYYYYFISMYYRCIFNKLGGDGVRSSLGNKDLLNIPIVSIDKSEQIKIAQYLDNKCTKIDQTIEKEKEVIEKLKEYKQSVITEAVTKGLNSDVKMKDSGVEWIGEIPEHWNIVKLGNIFKYIGGFAFSSDKYCDETDNQVIRIGNVKNDSLELNSKMVFISDEYAEKAKEVRVQENDILFTMTGTKGKRDYFYTLIIRDVNLLMKKLYINQRVGCFRKKANINSEYYNYLLKNNRILDSIFIYETGTANQGNLGIDTIKRTKVYCPSLEEQQQIVNYLDKKCSAIDKLITNKEKVIEKLTEYKKSLIYECVTGKREV